MKPRWLDISGKIDPALVELCFAVANCTSQLQIPYLIVGASARDLVMHHAYGATVQRATTDIDFALQVPSWDTFTDLQNTLIKTGFANTKEIQRLVAPNGLPIDIVPFGDIADETANIYWPPNSEFVMNVMGFQEAIENAVMVRLHAAPDLEVPVASPAGLILLKMIAWTDREVHLRNKDAKDVAYLLSTYETIPSVADYLYQDQSILEQYEWDLTLAAAHDFGTEARRIAFDATANATKAILTNRLPQLSTTRFIQEMSTRHTYARNSELLGAFTTGFLAPTARD